MYFFGRTQMTLTFNTALQARGRNDCCCRMISKSRWWRG